MKRTVLALLILSLCVVLSANEKQRRPRIVGISGINFYTPSLSAANWFYPPIFNSTPGDVCFWCEVPGKSEQSSTLTLTSGQQELTLTKSPEPAPSNLLHQVIFETDDLKAMRAHLELNHVSVKELRATYGSKALISTVDPEGHLIAFQQRTKRSQPDDSNTTHIIHAGFVVHDRAAEDKFYKDILGFHVYWHGGMKE